MAGHGTLSVNNIRLSQVRYRDYVTSCELFLELLPDLIQEYNTHQRGAEIRWCTFEMSSLTILITIRNKLARSATPCLIDLSTLPTRQDFLSCIDRTKSLTSQAVDPDTPRGQFIQ